MKSVPARLYTKKYYLGSCRGFEEFLKGGISERLLYAFSLANLKKGMQILDIGSGRGELVVKCAEAGVSAKGIDYSQAAVEIAKKGLKRMDRKVVKRILIEKMNAKKISYPDNSFDVIFMIDVAEHLYPEELRQVFMGIKRALKPDGRVIIHTPNAWLIKLITFLTQVFFRWEGHPGHVNEQSFFSLRRELKFFGGRKRIFFRPRKKCFSEIAGSVKNLPFWTVRLAGLLDRIWENKFLSFLIYCTPLVFFLGTDLWAIVELSKKDKLLK